MGCSSNYDAFDPQRYNTLHGYAEDLLNLLDELGVKVRTEGRGEGGGREREEEWERE